MAMRKKGAENAQPYEFDTVAIRLTGDLIKINDIIGKLKFVANLNTPIVSYANNRRPFGVDVYLQASIDEHPELKTLQYQLDEAMAKIDELSIELNQAHRKIENLKKKSKTTPKRCYKKRLERGNN